VSPCCQLTATHDGRPFEQSIMAIYRFEKGRIAEDWGISIRALWPWGSRRITRCGATSPPPRGCIGGHFPAGRALPTRATQQPPDQVSGPETYNGAERNSCLCDEPRLRPVGRKTVHRPLSIHPLSGNGQ
jgi:hypothetical protein